MTIVDQVFFMILDLLDEGFDLVMPIVMIMFSITFGSAVIRLIFGWMAGQMENMIGGIIVLCVMFWIFFTVAFAAKGITDGAGRIALTVGSGIVGADTMTADDFGPSALWGIGSGQADQILDTKRALCTSTWECTKTLTDQVMLEGAALGIYIAFAFLIFEMAMTILGYKINSLFMLIFTPTAILPFTKAFSEGAIQGTVNNLVKLTIIAMVAGFASRSFELMELPPKPVFDDIIPALLLAGFVAFLAWQSRVLAAGIISAVPQLSGQAITRAVGNTMRAAATGAGAATSAAMIGNREKATIANAAANIAGGMQRAPGRIANAAAAVKSGDVMTKAYWDKVRTANSNAGAARKTAGAGGGAGGGAGNPGTGGAWGGPPTDKQHQAARQRGVSLSNMTRGEASVALERAGMDKSWYGNGDGWGDAGGGPRTGGTGAAPSSPKATSTPNAPQKAPAASAPVPVLKPAAPTQHTPGGHHNDGRFMVPEPRIHSIGLGGGYGGTGWRNQHRASVRKHASSSLSGQKSANAEKMAMAVMREVHFGQSTKRL